MHSHPLHIRFSSSCSLDSLLRPTNAVICGHSPPLWGSRSPAHKAVRCRVAIAGHPVFLLPKPLHLFRAGRNRINIMGYHTPPHLLSWRNLAHCSCSAIYSHYELYCLVCSRLYSIGLRLMIAAGNVLYCLCGQLETAEIVRFLGHDVLCM